MSQAYLRVQVTRRCALRCPFCHGEGARGAGRALPLHRLAPLVRAGIASGVRKVKLLGGEALLAPGLEDFVAEIRTDGVDLSLVTAGVAEPARLERLFTAGLDRVNVSIHGFTEEAFRARAGLDHDAWRLRAAFLEALYQTGRPVKLNYVWTGWTDAEDLGALLDGVERRQGITVNLLDDLHQPELSWWALVGVLSRLRARAPTLHVEEDPCSLATLHLRWEDGLEVEIKHGELGRLAPWAACASCPRRSACREGIHAVRLSPEGRLRLCMDRPDLELDLARIWEESPQDPEGAVRDAWRRHTQFARRAA